jgi:dCTP diphosphatase
MFPTKTGDLKLLFLARLLSQLAELFQWRGDHVPVDSITTDDLDKIGQELADVTIYLIRLSDVVGVQLVQYTQEY